MTNPQAVLETPTDPIKAPVSGGEAPLVATKRRKHRRFQLFDDGGGDYRIYEVVAPGHKTMPAGSLLAVPEFGGYKDLLDAKKALRAKGDGLAGKTLLLLRGCELIRIVVETRPQVRIESKPRKQIGGPVETAGS